MSRQAFPAILTSPDVDVGAALDRIPASFCGRCWGPCQLAVCFGTQSAAIFGKDLGIEIEYQPGKCVDSLDGPVAARVPPNMHRDIR